MPELPEVETVRRGLAPHVVGRVIERVIVRDRRLRWPIARGFERKLAGRTIRAVDRRGKYLLLDLGGSPTDAPDGRDRVILHLGMTGRLSLIAPGRAVQKHDHLDLELSGGLVLRLNDPRRFGAALWWPASHPTHMLLKHMGPEPFADGFGADYLFGLARGRSAPVKNFLMDGRVVVGVGNIYAVESLFRAGIRPQRAAGRVTRAGYAKLARAVRDVLSDAIAAGGTTFRDFRNSNDQPGYFVQKLNVYDRAGEPCRKCRTPIKRLVIGQRSSYYCPACQR
ncbi:MAG: bifunctional DNA-formamidopyrimidine glycosylase/DNA-(apurinic or apyrimidinic site) lyase [Nevskiaceae bacterium]